MKLNRLLELHSDTTEPHHLSDNFGDSLLCKKNKIFSNIRKACLSRSYQFSSAQNEFYQALPLSQLEDVLTKKVIPYVNNVSVLKHLERNWPHVTEWDDLSDNLKRNFVFHESCHAVARSEALASQQLTDSLVLQMLIEESFANTCELLAVIDAEDNAHRIFYEISSYTSLFEERTNLKNAQTEIGSEKLMEFILLSYLHSNFLFESLDELQFKRILKIIFKENSPNPSQVKTMKRISKICFTLDEKFKFVTTGFYMRLNGYKMSQSNLLSFDFMARIEQTPVLQNYLIKIIKIALD
ncbi:MAG: hypothetical protein H7328_05945 [Bdellovibrio sp.]|nr:hypothetical protein [Bdellovibrio sp.]